MVDGYRRNLVNVVSEVPNGSVLGSSDVAPVYLGGFFYTIENMLYSFF